jgi:hypothetical protein
MRAIVKTHGLTLGLKMTSWGQREQPTGAAIQRAVLLKRWAVALLLGALPLLCGFPIAGA